MLRGAAARTDRLLPRTAWARSTRLLSWVASLPKRPAEVYSIYGFRIAIPGHFPFPLYFGDQDPEVKFVESASPLGAQRRRTNGGVVNDELADGSVYVRWEGLFEFRVSVDGRRVDFRAVGSTPPSAAFEVYGVAQALSFALLRLGAEPVHATVVQVAGRGIGFLGQPGAGKSTLGPRFLRRGGSLLTDDLMVTRHEADVFTAMPGVPRLKLFPEVAAVLLPGASGRRIHPGTPKLVYPLTAETFEGNQVRLDRLYVIRDGGREKVSVRPLSARTAFLRLTENTFNAVATGADRRCSSSSWQRSWRRPFP